MAKPVRPVAVQLLELALTHRADVVPAGMQDIAHYIVALEAHAERQGMAIGKLLAVVDSGTALSRNERATIHVMTDHILSDEQMETMQ